MEGELTKMALIEWNETYSVQVEEMNRQHRRLIELINQLDSAMRMGKGKDVLGVIINDLAKYTTTHFTAEESLFLKYNYPAASAQKAMHQLFIDKVNDFRKKYEEGSIALSVQVIDFLSDWLKKHIMVEDKKYGPFLNEKGIK